MTQTPRAMKPPKLKPQQKPRASLPTAMDRTTTLWLREHKKATPAQFMQKPREIYSREEMLKRFPHGF